MIRLRKWIALLALVMAPTVSVQSAEIDVVDIGDRRELFVDRHRIERTKGVELKMHSPVPQDVVWKPDAAWESTSAAYFTVFKDGDQYRMYYRGSPRDMPDVICYMTSKDGIHWERPKLGLFEFKGSKDNNIVWTGGPFRTSQMFAPFKDTRPGIPADEQYKALAGSPIHAFASPDGIKWRLLWEKPILTGSNFDSQNVAFWDSSKEHYVAFFRHRINGNIRSVATATSKDFLKWGEQTPIDLGDTPPEHLYTNGTLPYFRAPHHYFSFMKRYVPERSKFNEGVSDAVFLSSRDGLKFDRTFMEAFIRPGRDPRHWSARSNMPAWGLVQTASDEMSIYYLQGYRTHGIQLRRGVLRLDGVASAHAGYQPGELISKPVRFRGTKLVINYATSAVGSVRVELQDVAGHPLDGFALNDSIELFGDEIAEECKWKDSGDLSSLAGQPVRLRFVLKDADVYSYRFAP